MFGLAPTNDDRAYINQLWNQGQVADLKVGLNFENPEDKDQVSTVTFGYWDYSEVFGGEEGLNWYPNTAKTHWGVLMDDVSYNNQDIQGSVGGKLALIDSGNTSIQIPHSEFEQLKSLMME